jgi:hypothetical protein
MGSLCAVSTYLDNRPDLEWSESRWEVPMNPREALLSVILASASLRHRSPTGSSRGKVSRIWWLRGDCSSSYYRYDSQQCRIERKANFQAAMEGLREYGYVLGQNLLTECRWTEGRAERVASAFAAELVSLKPDLIIAGSTANVRALQQATSAISTVMGGSSTPSVRIPAIVNSWSGRS